MKRFTKSILSVLLTLCLLAVPMIGVSAEDAFNLMPTAEDGYTVVAGDGTVSIDGGVLTIVNNSDGDFRLTIDNPAAFDLTRLNTLHMTFHADMPFKMAYHIINAGNANDNDWLTTSDDYPTLLNVDLNADRAPAGDYDIEMELCETAVAMTDKSSVSFEQFIILLTGKGTFTLNTVEMVAREGAPVTDEPTTDDGESNDTDAITETPVDDSTTTEQQEESTTTKKPAADKEDAANEGSNGLPMPILLAVIVAVVVMAVVVIIIVKKRKA